MKTIVDYIYVANHIPVKFCKELIRECNKNKWKKHRWYNYFKDTTFSKKTKEPDVFSCTPQQQDKITPYLEKALEEYQMKNSRHMLQLQLHHQVKPTRLKTLVRNS